MSPVAWPAPRRGHSTIHRRVTAKQAREKRGDIGGAIFVARSFDEGVAERYRTATRTEDGSGSWLRDSRSPDTKVRADGRTPRFHLLLVIEGRRLS
jgi:hypothetical protein